MKALWDRLENGVKMSTLGSEDLALARKLGKATRHLADDPAHPGLQSHEITALSSRYGRKVFQSYLENNTPAAGRLYWVYGPDRHEITVIGLEPHPEDKKRGAYARVKLSALPPVGSLQGEAPKTPRGRKV